VITGSLPPILPMLLPGLACGCLIWLVSRAWTGHMPARVRRNARPGVSPPIDAERGIYRLVLEHASDVLMRLDSRWRRLLVTPSCKDVFGYEIDEVMTAPPLDLVHPDDRDHVRAVLSGLDAPDAVHEATWRAVHRDGHVVWIEATYRRIVEDGGAVVIMRDITKRKLTEDRLREARLRLENLSAIDILTGLPNRRGFLEAAARALAEDGEWALLFIDLDRFHAINQAHGHAAGDAVLRVVGSRLKREMEREPVVARLGADEFAVLSRVHDGDTEVAARARDLIRVIGEPIRHGGMALDTDATIGIAVSPRDGDDPTGLLHAADLAIAHAKQAGGGTYRFHERAMTEALERASRLRTELRRAIARDEIVPWFHPIVRLTDGAILGFEVVPHWVHSEFGPLDPDEFLPLAKETGGSTALLAALLRQACDAARGWPTDLRLALNVSARDLLDESLPADIARILAGAGLDGARLEVEIAERDLAPDSKVTRAVLDGLRAMGVTIVLDDFGTGFSSLWQLRDLPFDRIKIAGTFVGALRREPDNARYIAAIMGLGVALDLEVAADGIADAPALDRLRDLGCIRGQGSAIYPLMSAAEVARRFFPAAADPLQGGPDPAVDARMP
jgi:diguanylate cyclase (GGDEF)-like protein/PAS domain S-box-containing protein